MLIRIERIAERSDAESTSAQLTSDSSAATPIIAAAVWAKVLSARFRAAFSHSEIFICLISPHSILCRF